VWTIRVFALSEEQTPCRAKQDEEGTAHLPLEILNSITTLQSILHRIDSEGHVERKQCRRSMQSRFIDSQPHLKPSPAHQTKAVQLKRVISIQCFQTSYRPQSPQPSLHRTVLGQHIARRHHSRSVHS
jgi:hypothetical protein